MMWLLALLAAAAASKKTAGAPAGVTGIHKTGPRKAPINDAAAAYAAAYAGAGLPGADLARQLTPEQVIAFGLIHSTGGASLAYQSPAVQRATNAAVQGALRRLGF